MEKELSYLLSREGISRIQSVSRDESVQRAVNSLALWGVINIGVWFFLGKENREFLNSFTLTGEIYFLLYGGLIIGLTMFAFSFIGFVTRSSATIIFDGVSLIAVGIFNILYDFIAISALKEYGYIIDKPNTIWIILGLSQIVWGYRQLSFFGRLSGWKPAKLRKSEIHEIKKTLGSNFINQLENNRTGILKATISFKGPFGMDFMSETNNYTGKIIENCIIMVSSKFNDCFIIEQESFRHAEFDESGGIIVLGAPKIMLVDPVSVLMIKDWCNKKIIVNDIYRLVNLKAATLEILKPLLGTDDIKLRSAIINALSTINKDETKAIVVSLFDDTSNNEIIDVIIDACTKLKINNIQDMIFAFLKSPISSVRLSSVKYLTAFPTTDLVRTFEIIIQIENDTKVKNELKKSIKSLSKK